ncbi:MAG: BamA/TamA family outer membrane protein [Bdellovibrionota bacterium]
MGFWIGSSKTRHHARIDIPVKSVPCCFLLLMLFGAFFADRAAVCAELNPAIPTAGASPKPEAAPQSPAEPIEFVPLPVYATLPNEGPTYGFMPVFLDTDRTDGRIKSIFAPSLTWNGVTHVTTTGRYFSYPNSFEERLFQATYATRLFREATADWISVPLTAKSRTHVLSFQYRKDPFRRFFGIGKDTARNDETSYTLQSLRTFGRLGYNLTSRMNLSGTLGVNYYDPIKAGVLGLKSPFDIYPDVSGLDDAMSVYSLASFKYDSRPLREYSEEGYFAEASAGGAFSNRARNSFYGLTRLENRVVWKETSRLSGAARAYWGYTYGANLPFYEQQSLGGSFLLRGYILDRFVDNGAWTIDFEQRFTPLILTVEGTKIHFRLDPFITVGQVYTSASEMFERVRYAPGIGVRFFSPPSVIGRIDIAKGGPDINVYTELGYPF